MMVMNMNKMIGMIRMIKMIGMIRMIRMIRMISMMVIMVMVMMVMVMMVVVVIVLGKGQLQPGTVFGHQGLELVSRNDHICTRRQLKRSAVLTALRKLDTEITGQRTHWQDMWMDVSKTPAAGALLRSLQIAEVLKLRCVAMCCDVLRCVTVLPWGALARDVPGGVAQNDESQIPRSVPKWSHTCNSLRLQSPSRDLRSFDLQKQKRFDIGQA